MIDLRFLKREPADVYHAKAKDHLSSHALADFRRCPLLYHRKQRGLIPQRDSNAYLIGRAAHVLVLEGREHYEMEFAVGGPINPRTGKPFGSNTKKFSEWAERLGKPVLSDDQAALVEQMAASVKAHIFAAELLAEGVAERVVRCEYRGHTCQARLDWINPLPDRGLTDLKTADSLDTFEADAHVYGYIHQMAFYRTIIREASGIVLPVRLIVVEKREPFRCGVWEITQKVLDAAEHENAQAMDELAQCRESGIWPTRFESLKRIDQL